MHKYFKNELNFISPHFFLFTVSEQYLFLNRAGFVH